MNEPIRRPAPQVDYIDVQIHKEDLSKLIEILITTSSYYLELAASMAETDAAASKTFIQLSRMINAYNEKFKSNLVIGEPISREEH